MASETGPARTATGPFERFVAEPRQARVRLAAGAVALLGAASIAVVRLARNAPVDAGVLAGRQAHRFASTLAVLGPAAAAIALGVAAADDWERVGLVSAGTFTFLTLFSDAASVPASGVLVAAAAMTLVSGRPLRSRGAVVGAGFVGAVALSLGASSGVLQPSARSAGTAVTLVALVATPLAIRPSIPALAIGVLAAVLAAGAAIAAPFVAGASLLVVAAAVDPPLVLLAAAVGGVVATMASGALSGRPAAVIGGGLLLAAGVPATVPRALAVVIGAALILGSRDSKRADSQAVGSPTRGGESDAV